MFKKIALSGLKKMFYTTKTYETGEVITRRSGLRDSENPTCCEFTSTGTIQREVFAFERIYAIVSISLLVSVIVFALFKLFS